MQRLVGLGDLVDRYENMGDGEGRGESEMSGMVIGQEGLSDVGTGSVNMDRLHDVAESEDDQEEIQEIREIIQDNVLISQENLEISGLNNDLEIDESISVDNEVSEGLQDKPNYLLQRLLSNKRNLLARANLEENKERKLILEMRKEQMSRSLDALLLLPKRPISQDKNRYLNQPLRGSENSLKYRKTRSLSDLGLYQNIQKPKSKNEFRIKARTAKRPNKSLRLLIKFNAMHPIIKLSILDFTNYSAQNSCSLFLLMEHYNLSFLSEKQLRFYLKSYRRDISNLLGTNRVFRTLSGLQNLFRECVCWFSKSFSIYVEKTAEVFESEGEVNQGMARTRWTKKYIFSKLICLEGFKELVSRKSRLGLVDTLLKENVILSNYYAKEEELGMCYVYSNKGLEIIEQIEEMFYENDFGGFRKKYGSDFRELRTLGEASKNKSNFRRSVTRFSYIPLRSVKIGDILIPLGRDRRKMNIFTESKILMYHLGRDQDTHGLVINRPYYFENRWRLVGGPCDPKKVFVLHNLPEVPGCLAIRPGVYLGGQVAEYLCLMRKAYQMAEDRQRKVIDWRFENGKGSTRATIDSSDRRKREIGQDSEPERMRREDYGEVGESFKRGMKNVETSCKIEVESETVEFADQMADNKGGVKEIGARARSDFQNEASEVTNSGQNLRNLMKNMGEDLPGETTSQEATHDRRRGSFDSDRPVIAPEINSELTANVPVISSNNMLSQKLDYTIESDQKFPKMSVEEIVSNKWELELKQLKGFLRATDLEDLLKMSPQSKTEETTFGTGGYGPKKGGLGSASQSLLKKMMERAVEKVKTHPRQFIYKASDYITDKKVRLYFTNMLRIGLSFKNSEKRRSGNGMFRSQCSLNREFEFGRSMFNFVFNSAIRRLGSEQRFTQLK